MKAILPASIMLLLCAGCFTSSAPDVKVWTIKPREGEAPLPANPEGERPAFSSTRLGAVTVSAPYDKPQIVVHRADGSVVPDYYNVFAAPPSALLRSPVKSGLEGDRRFGHVTPQASVASTDAQVEVYVSNLSLDCTAPQARKARAEVKVDVVQTGRGPRKVVLSGGGVGEADAGKVGTEGCDYSAAFSRAFNDALGNALKSVECVDKNGK